MPDKTNDTIIATVMKQLMDEGPQAMVQFITALMNLAMRMECEQFLGAGHDERAAERRGYANGTKPKLIDTPAGTLTLDVPKTAGTDAPFYPQALEQGRRSSRAVMLAVAEMDVCGVSTRDVERVLAEFGLKSLSSTPQKRGPRSVGPPSCSIRNSKPGAVGSSAKSVTSFWMPVTRNRGRVAWYVTPPCCRQSKARRPSIRSLQGTGPAGPGGERRPGRPSARPRRVGGTLRGRSPHHGVLGRAFLEDLVARGMRGVQFITADDHAGLKAARKATARVVPHGSVASSTWRRMRSIRHRQRQLENESAANCARSGTPKTSAAPKPS